MSGVSEVFEVSLSKNLKNVIGDEKISLKEKFQNVASLLLIYMCYSNLVSTIKDELWSLFHPFNADNITKPEEVSSSEEFRIFMSALFFEENLKHIRDPEGYFQLLKMIELFAPKSASLTVYDYVIGSNDKSLRDLLFEVFALSADTQQVKMFRVKTLHDHLTSLLIFRGPINLKLIADFSYLTAEELHDRVWRGKAERIITFVLNNKVKLKDLNSFISLIGEEYREKMIFNLHIVT